MLLSHFIFKGKLQFQINGTMEESVENTVDLLFEVAVSNSLSSV